MVETKAPGSDELRLAQLACAKLAGLVQGALSVGLPALVTGVPEPRAFLHDRFRVLGAFAVVLHAACWPAGDTQAVLRLREKSSRLSSLLEDLRVQLLAALDAPDPARALGPARTTALAFFDAVEAYAALLQLTGATILKAKAVVLQTFDALRDLNPTPASSAG
jgi:hypothetical protein